MAIRVTEPNGLPRLRDASVLFKAATHRPVFARATDPRVAVEAGAESLAVS